jgi:nicotinamide-nucleotide amidase
MPTAEIITIGTELLLGETVDTNTAYIARMMRELGIDLYHTHMVGDNPSRISEVVRSGLELADIIITTGGLGPTVDDPTRQALAETAGVELEFHPELWEQISARIARYGRTPTENQKRQAYIPKGARVIENQVGTAPAFILELHPENKPKNNSPKVVIALPGVPKEMETLLKESVVPYLQKTYHLDQIILVRTLHVSGIGEGSIDEQIGEFETMQNPTIGLTAHSGVVDIRIAAKAGSETGARRMIAKVEKDLRLILKENIFGADGDTLVGVIFDTLIMKRWRLACFEYGLQGALINLFSQIGNPLYLGGTENNIDSLKQRGEEIKKKFGAEVCLGITLHTQEHQQVVSLFIETPLTRIEKNQTFGGHPQNASRWAVNMGLDLLRRNLQGTD